MTINQRSTNSAGDASGPPTNEMGESSRDGGGTAGAGGAGTAGAGTPEPPLPQQRMDDLNAQSVSTAQALQAAALQSMKRNMAMNTTVRTLFYVGAAGALIFIGFVLSTRFDRFIQTMVNASASDGVKIFSTVLSLTLPLLLAAAGAALCVLAAITIQSRGNAEFAKAHAQISRSIRESPLAPSRSLALTQILEETLANARRAFGIQIWISRVLFGSGVALLFVFVGSLFFGSTLVSGGAAVTSLLALVSAALLNPQRQIRSDLANVTQLGVILAGYTRQASIIEDYLYQAVISGAAHQPTTFYQGVDRLQKALEQTVQGISRHVMAPDEVSGREAWLWQQLALRSSNASAPNTVGSADTASPSAGAAATG